jgi:hypothetical protein
MRTRTEDGETQRTAEPYRSRRDLAFFRAQLGGGVTVVRSALEIAGIVVSSLLVVVGGGLTSDPVILMMTAVGISLSLMLAALLAKWWRPGRVKSV